MSYKWTPSSWWRCHSFSFLGFNDSNPFQRSWTQEIFSPLGHEASKHKPWNYSNSYMFQGSHLLRHELSFVKKAPCRLCEPPRGLLMLGLLQRGIGNAWGCPAGRLWFLSSVNSNQVSRASECLTESFKLLVWTAGTCFVNVRFRSDLLCGEL